MRVVMVIGKSTGGIGSHVSDLASGLREQGHQVRIMTDVLTMKHFSFDNADILWPLRPRSWQGFKEVARRMLKARRLLLSAQIVHAHGIQAAFLVTLLTGHFRPPFVVSLHNEINTSYPRWLTFLVRRRIARAALIVAGSSSDLVHQARRDGARRAMLSPIPSPLVEDLLAYSPYDRPQRAKAWNELSTSQKITNQGQLVLSVGKITKSKRFDLLIRAADYIRRGASIVVIGSGDENLEATLRSQGQEMKVAFVGPRDSLEPFMRCASVLVICSDWEARSLIVQEAMAAGIPVVATRVGGLIDLLDEEPGSVKGPAGILVPPNDPKSLGRAIDLLLADPSQWYKYQAAGIERAGNWASISQVVAEWEALYKQILFSNGHKE